MRRNMPSTMCALNQVVSKVLGVFQAPYTRTHSSARRAWQAFCAHFFIFFSMTLACAFLLLIYISFKSFLFLSITRNNLISCCFIFHRRSMNSDRRSMKFHRRSMKFHRRSMKFHRRSMKFHRRSMIKTTNKPPSPPTCFSAGSCFGTEL